MEKGTGTASLFLDHPRCFDYGKEDSRPVHEPDGVQAEEVAAAETGSGLMQPVWCCVDGRACVLLQEMCGLQTGEPAGTARCQEAVSQLCELPL